MIRTIIWFAYFFLYQIFAAPVLLYAKILEKRNKNRELDRLVDKVVSSWARSLVRLSGSKVTVTGQENIPETGPVVFIGNHQGNFDIPIIMGYINKPKAFISKIEVKKIPLVSAWMKYMHCVFMDRDDIRQSVAAINTGVEYLKQGYSLVIFPEGTRSRGNEIGEFKPGSFKLATKANVPIVPVTINSSYKIMEQNGSIIKPASVELIISPAIETSNMSNIEKKDLHEVVKKIISSNLKVK